MNKIIQAAVRWVEQIHPCGWTLAQHLENPTVNCNGKVDQALAFQTLQYLKRRKVRGCRDCGGTVRHMLSCPTISLALEAAQKINRAAKRKNGRKLRVYGKYRIKHEGKVYVGTYYGTTKADRSRNFLVKDKGIVWIAPENVLGASRR